MKKFKLKTFSNWMAKTKVRVGDKVIKLHEERELLGRFLIIQGSRPELVPKLEETIGKYEILYITKKTWVGAYMELDEDDPSINCFRELGEGPIPTELVDDELPTQVKDLEQFVCRVYCSKGPKTLPALRWTLFPSLPPIEENGWSLDEGVYVLCD
jgi:hypothetical protein